MFFLWILIWLGFLVGALKAAEYLLRKSGQF